MNGCAHLDAATQGTFSDVARLCAEADLILHFYPAVSDRQIERLKAIVAEVRAKATADQGCQRCVEEAPSHAIQPISRKLLVRLPLSLLAMYTVVAGVLLIVQCAVVR